MPYETKQTLTPHLPIARKVGIECLIMPLNSYNMHTIPSAPTSSNILKENSHKTALLTNTTRKTRLFVSRPTVKWKDPFTYRWWKFFSKLNCVFCGKAIKAWYPKWAFYMRPESPLNWFECELVFYLAAVTAAAVLLLLKQLYYILKPQSLHRSYFTNRTRKMFTGWARPIEIVTCATQN